MLDKFRDYIERGSWEKDMEKGDNLLEAGCWVMIVLAALYFGWGVLRAIQRGAL